MPKVALLFKDNQYLVNIAQERKARRPIQILGKDIQTNPQNEDGWATKLLHPQNGPQLKMAGKDNSDYLITVSTYKACRKCEPFPSGILVCITIVSCPTVFYLYIVEGNIR